MKHIKTIFLERNKLDMKEKEYKVNIIKLTIFLSCFDDKRYMLDNETKALSYIIDDGTNALSYGNKDIN